MNARQQRTLARFNHILAFLGENAATIPATLMAPQRQLLATVVAHINSFTQAQLVKGAASPASRTVASARTTLRDTYVRQLSTIGLHSLTGQTEGDPNVANAVQIFTMPATRGNSLTIIAAATAMLSVATQYAGVFTAAGMNLDQVSTAIEALEAALTGRGAANRVSEGATQGIKAQIRAGKKAVRIMDVMIRPILTATPELLKQWQTVKRSAGGPKFANPAPQPAAPPSAPADAPSTQATPPAAVDSAA